MSLPTFFSYCGAHALAFEIGDITVYFSYHTPVAYYTNGSGSVVRENEWGPTTGKHLNAIDSGDKESRIPGDEFEKRLEELLNVKT